MSDGPKNRFQHTQEKRVVGRSQVIADRIDQKFASAFTKQEQDLLAEIMFFWKDIMCHETPKPNGELVTRPFFPVKKALFQKKLEDLGATELKALPFGHGKTKKYLRFHINPEHLIPFADEIDVLIASGKVQAFRDSLTPEEVGYFNDPTHPAHPASLEQKNELRWVSENIREVAAQRSATSAAAPSPEVERLSPTR